MHALCLGLSNIQVGNLAQISWEHVNLLKNLPISFNKRDLQRRGGENGESQFRKQDHSADISGIWLAARFSKLPYFLVELEILKQLGSKENLFYYEWTAHSFIWSHYYGSPKERRRGKWGRKQVSKALGLGERVSCGRLGICTGTSEEEVLHQRPAGLMENGRFSPRKKWQHYLSETGRSTQPPGPRLFGAWFPQCGNSMPQQVLWDERFMTPSVHRA